MLGLGLGFRLGFGVRVNDLGLGLGDYRVMQFRIIIASTRIGLGLRNPTYVK